MKKILVAEGSPTIKSVADSVLRQNGYDVVCTSDGLQAWEVISAEKPDLVLTGLGLSSMSGLDLCRQIAKDQLTGGVPTVLMIGPKDPISDEEVQASGARGKLRKPFSPKELLDIVGNLTGNIIDQPKPVDLSEPGTDHTNYNPQVMSTQAMKPKSESVKLDWLDLNDAAPSIKKVVSLDANSDEQQLIIEEDQYGLARQHNHNAPASGMKDKDDYEWFIGEMKREIDNKPSANRPTDTPEPPKLGVEEAPASEDMHFDSIEPSKEPIESLSVTSYKAQASSVAEIDAQPLQHLKDLTEEEISLIVNRVTAKLAAQIAAAIDKSQIIDAVKAALK